VDAPKPRIEFTVSFFSYLFKTLEPELQMLQKSQKMQNIAEIAENFKCFLSFLVNFLFFASFYPMEES